MTPAAPVASPPSSVGTRTTSSSAARPRSRSDRVKAKVSGLVTEALVVSPASGTTGAADVVFVEKEMYSAAYAHTNPRKGLLYDGDGDISAIEDLDKPQSAVSMHNDKRLNDDTEVIPDTPLLQLDPAESFLNQNPVSELPQLPVTFEALSHKKTAMLAAGMTYEEEEELLTAAAGDGGGGGVEAGGHKTDAQTAGEARAMEHSLALAPTPLRAPRGQQPSPSLQRPRSNNKMKAMPSLPDADPRDDSGMGGLVMEGHQVQNSPRGKKALDAKQQDSAGGSFLLSLTPSDQMWSPHK